MLLRAFATVGRQARSSQRSQIKQRKYSTVVHETNEKVWIPKTTVLDSVLQNKEGHQSLTEAYTQAMAELNQERSAILDRVNQLAEQDSLPSVRSAVAKFNETLAKISYESDIDMNKLSLPASKLDEAFEVHELTELYEAYKAGFNAIPYTPQSSHFPVDGFSEKFASVQAEMTVAKINLEKLEAKYKAQADAAGQRVVDLMYAKADDYLASHPEIEAQMEAEIKENRWDLLLKEED